MRRSNTLAAGAAMVALVVLAACTNSPRGERDAGESDRKPTAGAETDGGESADIRARGDWFSQQRAYPGTSLTSDPLVAAARRTAVQPRGASLGPAAVPAPSLAWTSIGPTPISSGVPNYYAGAAPWSGRVTSIANSRTNPSLAYIGAADGGVWKTTDDGATWTPVFDAQVNQTVGAVAVDPMNDQDVYAGTGEANYAGDSYPGVGLFHSTDGGATWAKVGGTTFDNCTIGKVIVLRDSVHTVLVAASNLAIYANGCVTGVYRSNGSGGFTLTLPGGTEGAADVVAEPGAVTDGAAVVYAAIWSIGISKSTDSGATWTPLGGGLPTTVGRIALAVNPFNPLRVVAAFSNSAANNFTTLGTWTSPNEGTSWTQVPGLAHFCAYDETSPESYSQCWYDLAVAADPNDVDVYAAGIRLQRWNGSTMTTIGHDGVSTTGMHVDIHALSFDSSGRLWIGSDGGVFRRDPTASSNLEVVNLNATLSLSQFVGGVGGSLATGQAVVGGTQDNGSLRHSSVACGATPGPCWEQYLDGDGGYSAYVPTGATTAKAYPTYTFGDTYRFGVSNGDATQEQCLLTSSNTPGCPNLSGNYLFYSPVATGNGGARLYVGGWHNLIDLENANASPSPTEVAAPGDQQSSTAVVTAMAEAPSDTNTVYAAWKETSRDKAVLAAAHTTVESTVDPTTFVGSHSSGTLLPNRYVTSITVSPTDPATAWVTFSGYNRTTAAQPGHVFVTHDRGATWTNVSGNLPDVPVSSLRLDTRTTPFTMYLATDTGVFWSQDSGTTWSSAGTGMPHTIVTDLIVDTASDTLIAATYGRGMYTTALPSTPPTATLISPASAKAGAPVTITGTDLLYTRGVTFHGLSAAITATSPTQVTATVPLAATTGPVVVATTGGSVTASASYTITPSVPLPPGTPVATAYNTQIGLTWPAPSSAGASAVNAYRVERSTNGVTWTVLTSTAPIARAYTAGGLANGTAYRFRVSAHNASGWGAPSAAVTATPRTVPTTTPTPTAVAYNAQITLSWAAPSSAGSKAITSYRVQRSTNGTTWTLVTSLAPLTRTYTVGSLANGTTYQFRVAAINAVGQGNWSAVVKAAPKTVPTAPRSPVAKVATHKVTLTWTAPTSAGSKPITSYRIQRSTNGTTWTTVTSAAPLSRTFAVTGLTNGTAYKFRIAAINALGQSNWSPIVGATPHV